jgi:hypothetical protein
VLNAFKGEITYKSKSYSVRASRVGKENVKPFANNPEDVQVMNVKAKPNFDLEA